MLEELGGIIGEILLSTSPQNQKCYKLLQTSISRNMFVVFVCLMVINATFNNISVISWRSVLLMEETGGLGENH